MSSLKMKKLKPKEGAYQDFLDYLSHTTVHGLRFWLPGENDNIERVFWLVAVIFSFIVAGVFIHGAYVEWEELPTVTNIKTSGLPVGDIQVALSFQTYFLPFSSFLFTWSSLLIPLALPVTKQFFS